MTTVLDRLKPEQWRLGILALLAVLTLGMIYAYLYFKMPQLLVIPLGIVLVLVTLVDFRPAFYLLVFSIPISFEFQLTPGTMIEMPAEPLMLLLLVVFIFRSVGGRQFRWKGKIRGFHIGVFLLLFWTAYTTLFSAYPLRSTKFLLAKVWYIVSLVYLAQQVLQRPEDVRRLFWTLFWSMLTVTLFITIKHAAEGFSFESAHNIPNPPFANGVIYAATLALFIPWCWFAKSWYSPRSLQWYVIIGGMAIFIFATLLTFKRAAWLALVLLPIVALMVRRRLLVPVIYSGLVVVALGLGWLIKDNNFYAFAPNYQRTIWHEGDIRGHLKATFSGTEISSMERFYRWVAAKNMVSAMPITGSGPSTFNQVYKQYADDAFRTYVSDNPEQSTTHNYFLHTFAEQGVVGGLIFLTLCIFMVVKASRLGQEITDPYRRSILMLALLSLITILFMILFNELIEVGKVGAPFWLCLVLIHKSEVWQEAARQNSIPEGGK